jgi:hypothetical protein
MSFIDWELLDQASELTHNLKIVIQLNKLFEIDPELTKKLVDTRYPVSKAYTEADEFVYMQDKDEDIPEAGLVGVLSGLTLDTTRFRIAANYDDNNVLTGFNLLKLVGGKFVKA